MNAHRQAELEVAIVGGGMITHDQILPSLYHLQRLGCVGGIRVCALNSAPLRALAEAPRFAEAFPGQSFAAYPGLDAAAGADCFPSCSRRCWPRCRRGTWWWWPCPTISTTA